MKKAISVVLLAILVVTFLMATKQKNKELDKELHRQIMLEGNIDEVKKLLEAGVDVNKRTNVAVFSIQGSPGFGGFGFRSPQLLLQSSHSLLRVLYLSNTRVSIFPEFEEFLVRLYSFGLQPCSSKIFPSM